MKHPIGMFAAQPLDTVMKIADDYDAKYRLWARTPRTLPAPPPAQLPRFKSRRFSSHAEMNEWKKSLLREFAELAAEK